MAKKLITSRELMAEEEQVVGMTVQMAEGAVIVERALMVEVAVMVGRELVAERGLMVDGELVAKVTTLMAKGATTLWM